MPTTDRPCLRAPSVPFRKGTVKGSSVPSVPPIGGHTVGHGHTIPGRSVRARAEGTAGEIVFRVSSIFGPGCAVLVPTGSEKPKAAPAGPKPKARRRNGTTKGLLAFETLKGSPSKPRPRGRRRRRGPNGYLQSRGG